MASARWERLAAGAGIVFVVFFVAGGILAGTSGGDTSDPAADVAQNLLDAEFQVYAASTLLGLAGAALVWFAGSLRTVLRRAEGDAGRLSAVAFGGAVAHAALTAVGATMYSASVFELADYQKSEETARAFFGTAGTVVFFGSALMLGVLIAAASLVGRRTGALPRWLANPGVVLGVLMALGWQLWPVASFGNMLAMVWVLITSIMLVSRAGSQAPA